MLSLDSSSREYANASGFAGGPKLTGGCLPRILCLMFTCEDHAKVYT